MADPFVPEADAAEQQREVAPAETEPEGQAGAGALSAPAASESALAYPSRRPLEADDADVLEQSQPADVEDDDRR